MTAQTGYDQCAGCQWLGKGPGCGFVSAGTPCGHPIEKRRFQSELPATVEKQPRDTGRAGIEEKRNV